MFKTYILVFLATILFCGAEPNPKPGVLAAAPLAVAPAVVTATSSQSFVRGVSAPLVTAPVFASPYFAAPYIAAPYVASPYAAAPLVAL